ncbi:MAG: hypothetical protein IKA49_02265 [Alistipes sp.]|nr:hypothetical protein [Alistipes sp.]
MRKFYLLLLVLCCLSYVAVAQTAREEIDAHPHIAVNTHSVYAAPYFSKPIADAPKGYKPFYISHYGRHGSRYEASQLNVDRVMKPLCEAEKLGLLTPKGRELLEYIKKFALYQRESIGELTSIGVEQHKGIARRMYNRFKGVFAPHSLVDSRSSIYSRCIISMASFNESLKECQPALRTKLETGVRHGLVIRPLTQDNPMMPRGVTMSTIKRGQPYMDKLAEWAKGYDINKALGKIFTDTKPLEFKKGDFVLAVEIYVRLAFGQNFGWDTTELMNSIFSADDRYAIYGYLNYSWYNAHVSSATPFSRKVLSCTRPLVEDIIKYADLAIEGKNEAVANLRFGHDYFLLALLGVISFNEYSAELDVTDIDRFNDVWRGFRTISMASNLQMVMYRSKKSDDVLVRFLHNENDVTLPIKGDKAPFYKWGDVKSYLLGRLDYLSK